MVASVPGEYTDERVNRINDALTSNEWDAIVVLGGENVQYLSGAWIPYWRGYLDRPNLVVWPSSSRGATFISGIELISGIAPSSFLSKFVGYEENGALPPGPIADKLADVLREEGLAESRIALEMLRTPVPFYDRLRQLLPGAEFVAADDVLRRLRQVKTSDEIKRIATGARVTDDGIWKGFQSVHAGSSERELGAAIQLNVLGNGCSGMTTLLVGTGEGARILGPPTERVLKRGDIVRIDLNSIYDGYFCDMGRTAVVGEANDAQRKAYRDQIDLKERIFDFMKPGRTCAEVYRYYREQAEKIGVTLFIYPYIGLGHGIGVNADEYPKLNQADQTVIEAGMILNVEPDTIGPEGEIFHVEDMVVVREDGVEPISQSRDWSSEIPVIAG